MTLATMNKQEERRASLARDRAAKELASAFELMGLDSMLARNVAYKHCNAAMTEVHSAVARLLART
jgi:hypothetical protein